MRMAASTSNTLRRRRHKSNARDNTEGDVIINDSTGDSVTNADIKDGLEDEEIPLNAVIFFLSFSVPIVLLAFLAVGVLVGKGTGHYYYTPFFGRLT